MRKIDPDHIEKILKKSKDLRRKGELESAFKELRKVCVSRRNRNWSETNENMYYEFIDLGIEIRKSSILKNGLIQFRALCQTSNINSLDYLIVTYLDKLDERIESELAKASVEEEGEENEEDRELIEDILLKGESRDNRKKRVVLIPWLKFAFETYRNILEILKNIKLLEFRYHSSFRRALLFCQRHDRRSEFRKFLDYIQSHFEQIKDFTAAERKREELNEYKVHLNGRILGSHIESRIFALDVCFARGYYQSAFNLSGSIYKLFKLRKKFRNYKHSKRTKVAIDASNDRLDTIQLDYYIRLLKLYKNCNNCHLYAFSCQKILGMVDMGVNLPSGLGFEDIINQEKEERIKEEEKRMKDGSDRKKIEELTDMKKKKKRRRRKKGEKEEEEEEVGEEEPPLYSVPVYDKVSEEEKRKKREEFLVKMEKEYIIASTLSVMKGTILTSQLPNYLKPKLRIHLLSNPVGLKKVPNRTSLVENILGRPGIESRHEKYYIQLVKSFSENGTISPRKFCSLLKLVSADFPLKQEDEEKQREYQFLVDEFRKVMCRKYIILCSEFYRKMYVPSMIKKSGNFFEEYEIYEVCSQLVYEKRILVRIDQEKQLILFNRTNELFDNQYIQKKVREFTKMMTKVDEKIDALKKKLNTQKLSQEEKVKMKAEEEEKNEAKQEHMNKDLVSVRSDLRDRLTMIEKVKFINQLEQRSKKYNYEIAAREAKEDWKREEDERREMEERQKLEYQKRQDERKLMEKRQKKVLAALVNYEKKIHDSYVTQVGGEEVKDEEEDMFDDPNSYSNILKKSATGAETVVKAASVISPFIIQDSLTQQQIDLMKLSEVNHFVEKKRASLISYLRGKLKRIREIQNLMNYTELGKRQELVKVVQERHAIREKESQARFEETERKIQEKSKKLSSQVEKERKLLHKYRESYEVYVKESIMKVREEEVRQKRTEKEKTIALERLKKKMGVGIIKYIVTQRAIKREKVLAEIARLDELKKKERERKMGIQQVEDEKNRLEEEKIRKIEEKKRSEDMAKRTWGTVDSTAVKFLQSSTGSSPPPKRVSKPTIVLKSSGSGRGSDPFGKAKPIVPKERAIQHPKPKPTSPTIPKPSSPTIKKPTSPTPKPTSPTRREQPKKAKSGGGIFGGGKPVDHKPKKRKEDSTRIKKPTSRKESSSSSAPKIAWGTKSPAIPSLTGGSGKVKSTAPKQRGERTERTTDRRDHKRGSSSSRRDRGPPREEKHVDPFGRKSGGGRRSDDRRDPRRGRGRGRDDGGGSSSSSSSSSGSGGRGRRYDDDRRRRDDRGGDRRGGGRRSDDRRDPRRRDDRGSGSGGSSSSSSSRRSDDRGGDRRRDDRGGRGRRSDDRRPGPDDRRGGRRSGGSGSDRRPDDRGGSRGGGRRSDDRRGGSDRRDDNRRRDGGGGNAPPPNAWGVPAFGVKKAPKKQQPSGKSSKGGKKKSDDGFKVKTKKRKKGGRKRN